MGLLDALTTVGNVLDTPGSMARNVLAGRNPFKGFLNPKERIYGRDLLEQWGALDANQPGMDFGDVLGFGVDVMSDPLNLLGLGLASRTAKAAGAAKSANVGIQSANEASQAMRAAGALPEELLPQARKLYHFSPEDVLDVPGKLPGRELLDHPLTDNLRDLGKLSDSYFSGPPRQSVYPGIGEYTPSQIGELTEGARRLNVSMGGDDLRAAMEELLRRQSGLTDEGDELTRALTGWEMRKLGLDENDRIALRIMELGDLLKSPRDPGELLSASGSLGDVLSKRELKLMGDVDDEFFDAANPRSVNPGSPTDNWSEVARDPASSLGDELRFFDQQQFTARRLQQEAERLIHPAPASSQSFYAVPQKPGDYSLDEFPYFGRGSSYSRAHVEGGTPTYLPYVAPALKDLNRIPRQTPLLASLLGHNALARQ